MKNNTKYLILIFLHFDYIYILHFFIIVKIAKFVFFNRFFWGIQTSGEIGKKTRKTRFLRI